MPVGFCRYRLRFVIKNVVACLGFVLLLHVNPTRLGGLNAEIFRCFVNVSRKLDDSRMQFFRMVAGQF